jgi:hypothetical protein
MIQVSARTYAKLFLTYLCVLGVSVLQCSFSYLLLETDD